VISYVGYSMHSLLEVYSNTQNRDEPQNTLIQHTEDTYTVSVDRYTSDHQCCSDDHAQSNV